MCPDRRAIDHVSGGVVSRQFGQRLEHGIEHGGRNPSSITPEDAVPLAILIWQVTPLRSGPRDPHHTFEIGAIILCRLASAIMLRRQQQPDHFPFFVRNTDPLAQGRLQKPALNQRPSPQSSFVHEIYPVGLPVWAKHKSIRTNIVKLMSSVLELSDWKPARFPSLRPSTSHDLPRRGR